MPAWIDVHFISLLNGLAIGSLLFILAVGLSLIFGMMDVLNLAHGVLFLAGAYALWGIGGGGARRPGFPARVGEGGLAGAGGGGGLAVVVERLARRSHLAQALLTLRVTLIAAD